MRTARRTTDKNLSEASTFLVPNLEVQFFSKCSTILLNLTPIKKCSSASLNHWWQKVGFEIQGFPKHCPVIPRGTNQSISRYRNLSAMPNDTNVAQQENNGFGPPFKPRGKAAVITSLVIIMIITMSGVVLVFLVRERGCKEGIKEGLNVD